MSDSDTSYVSTWALTVNSHRLSVGAVFSAVGDTLARSRDKTDPKLGNADTLVLMNVAADLQFLASGFQSSRLLINRVTFVLKFFPTDLDLIPLQLSSLLMPRDLTQAATDVLVPMRDLCHLDCVIRLSLFPLLHIHSPMILCLMQDLLSWSSRRMLPSVRVIEGKNVSVLRSLHMHFSIFIVRSIASVFLLLVHLAVIWRRFTEIRCINLPLTLTKSPGGEEQCLGIKFVQVVLPSALHRVSNPHMNTVPQWK